MLGPDQRTNHTINSLATEFPNPTRTQGASLTIEHSASLLAAGFVPLEGTATNARHFRLLLPTLHHQGEDRCEGMAAISLSLETSPFQRKLCATVAIATNSLPRDAETLRNTVVDLAGQLESFRWSSRTGIRLCSASCWRLRWFPRSSSKPEVPRCPVFQSRQADSRSQNCPQKFTRNPTCKLRGPAPSADCVEVIRPKVEDDRFRAGKPKFVWFNRLVAEPSTWK